MLNEVKARHLKKLVKERIAPGVAVGTIIRFEIARRADTVRGLMAQKEREQDEMVYLESLDANELRKEVEERGNG